MAPVTAATTIGQLGQNLLQGSSPSLTTLKKEAEEKQKRWREDRSEAHRHHDCVEREQNKLQKVKDDVHWQCLLTVTGAAGESRKRARCFTKYANDKSSAPKRARSPDSYRASQPQLLEPDQTPRHISLHHLGVPFSKT